MCILFARYMLSGHSFSHHFLKCTYTDFFLTAYFVQLLSTRNSDWNTNAQAKNIFLCVRISAYFYAAITKNANLINIPISTTENNIDCSICQAKTSVEYSRSRHDGKPGEMAFSTRRGRQRDESRVFVRMLGCASLLPVAVLARPVVVS